MKNELVNYRNHTLNYVKAAACICVLMLHCGFPGVYGKILYGPSRFAVPFFFMISGYYVYYEDTEKIIYRLPKKIKHITVLLLWTEFIYLMWHIIESAVKFGFGGITDWILRTFTIQKFIQFITFQTTPIGDVSWFMVAQILCYLVTYPIAKYNLWKATERIAPWLLLINILVGEFIPFFGITTQWYWCSNFWILGFPFYVMGYWIRQNQETLCKKITITKTVEIVILSVILITIERFITEASQFFVGNIFLALALFLFSVKYPSIFRIRNLVENIGEKYVFYIYILHPIIRDVYNLFFRFIGLENNMIISWIRPLIVFFVCLTTSQILYAIKTVNICRKK